MANVDSETPRFHNVTLGDHVKRARHAMAIDETRMKFEPTFWEYPTRPAPNPKADLSPEAAEKDAEDAAARAEAARQAAAQDAAGDGEPRVKQVWFEGAHSDIGGGYGQTGLSDTTLLWMAEEAWKAGLVFDARLLSKYVNSGSDPIRHNPLSTAYFLDNAILHVTDLRNGDDSEFRHGLRRLDHDGAPNIRIASSAQTHYVETNGDKKNAYAPRNLVEFGSLTNGFVDVIEDVRRMPEPNLDLSHLGEPAPGTAHEAGGPRPG